MKRLLVVALVAVVLLTGIPVVMGMPLMACADCDLATIVATSCMLAVLTAMVAVALTLLAVRVPVPPALLAGLIPSSGLDRPPRLA